jgi:hypothetical protein
MAKQDTKDILLFLEPFDDRIRDLAMQIRGFIWDLYPECNELIYDNYNAVAAGWAPTDRVSDIFCSIAVYSNKDMHFGFYWGAKLKDPKKLLQGKGKQYRFLRVTEFSDIPADYVHELLAEAYLNSRSKLKVEPSLTGETIVKSISAKKKRPA